MVSNLANPDQFSVRDVPWMKLGTVIDTPVKAAEAMKLANLDFDVERRGIGFQTENKGYKRIPGRSALVDPKTSIHYGIVADGYEVVQYREAFEFIDAINPNIVAAGALKSGRQAFMVVKADGHFDMTVLGDDPHELYVVLRTSHDGSKAVEISIMPLRGLCMNMMPIASFGRRAQQRWSIRHVKTAREQLREAHNVLTGLDDYARAYTSTAELLAGMPVGTEEARELLEVVLPDRPRREEVVEQLVGMLSASDTVGHVGTGWGLVNVVGEYFDHLRSSRNTTPESRMINALSGVTSKSINRTTQLLLRRGDR